MVNFNLKKRKTIQILNTSTYRQSSTFKNFAHFNDRRFPKTITQLNRYIIFFINVFGKYRSYYVKP